MATKKEDEASLYPVVTSVNASKREYIYTNNAADKGCWINDGTHEVRIESRDKLIDALQLFDA